MFTDRYRSLVEFRSSSSTCWSLLWFLRLVLCVTRLLRHSCLSAHFRCWEHETNAVKQARFEESRALLQRSYSLWTMHINLWRYQEYLGRKLCKRRELRIVSHAWKDWCTLSNLGENLKQQELAVDGYCKHNLISNMMQVLFVRSLLIACLIQSLDTNTQCFPLSFVVLGRNCSI